MALNAAEDGLNDVGLIQRPSRIGAIASRTARNSRSGKRGANFEPAFRPSAAPDAAGESGCQSPERACQPSSRMKVSTPSRRAIGATSRTVAMSMSSLAPVEIRFASVPFELNVTACSYGREPVLGQVAVELPRLVAAVAARRR